MYFCPGPSKFKAGALGTLLTATVEGAEKSDLVVFQTISGSMRFVYYCDDSSVSVVIFIVLYRVVSAVTLVLCDSRAISAVRIILC